MNSALERHGYNRAATKPPRTGTLAPVGLTAPPLTAVTAITCDLLSSMYSFSQHAFWNREGNDFGARGTTLWARKYGLSSTLRLPQTGGQAPAWNESGRLCI